MRLDYVIPGSIDRATVTGAEPITLAEAKTYLRIGFDDDDALITEKITEAREWAENVAGISIVQRNVACTIHMGSPCRSLELPYGPVIGEIAGASNEDPEIVLQDKNIMKGPFPRITGVCGLWDVNYSAGYTEVPVGLKQVILAKIADLYENRGDTDTSNYGRVAAFRLKTYKRITAWV